MGNAEQSCRPSTDRGLAFLKDHSDDRPSDRSRRDVVKHTSRSQSEAFPEIARRLQLMWAQSSAIDITRIQVDWTDTSRQAS
jgi:hypothetical protein